MPADRRDDWREEWLAELEWRHGSFEGEDPWPARTLLSDASGALPDALCLLTQTWSVAPMLNDISFALRALFRRPGFAVLSVLTLALGIGATTAIFSVVDAVLLRPLPYTEPDRLVALWEKNPDRGWTQAEIAPANFFDWQEQTHSFSGLAAYSDYPSKMIIGGETEPRHARAAVVSGEFFAVLGVEPLLGQTFTSEETWDDGTNNVIISHRLWQDVFAGTPKVIGSPLRLNGVDTTVIGVLPEHFRWFTEPVDIWNTLHFARDQRDATWFRRAHFLRVVGRLGAQVSLEQANRDLEAVAARLEAQYPETNVRMGAGLSPLQTWIVGDTKKPLLLLLGAVGMVLLIACANVANLLLARSTARLREFALRSALGAGRIRLLCQLLTENLVMATFAAILGIGFAQAGLRLLVALSPADIPRLDEVNLDVRVLAFALLVSLATTLIFGLGPSMVGSRARLRVGAPTRSTSAGREHSRVRNLLVVTEVALALLVVLATGLLGRSYWNLYAVEPGFDPEGALAVEISLPPALYSERDQVNSFYDQLTTRVSALPGVESAATTTILPLVNQGWSSDLSVEGKGPSEVGVEIRFGEVSADYFSTLGTQILAGREFDSNDGSGSPLVVVVNETLRRQMFAPEESPIGRRVASVRVPTPDTSWYTIVGVVGDIHHFGLNETARPQVFFSLGQKSSRDRDLVVRADLTDGRRGDPSDLIASLRTAVKDVDAQIPLMRVRTLEHVVATSVARQRFVLAQLGLFGVVALLLAAIGTYGVLAYAVSQRTTEIGVRMAIGASRAEVLRLVLRQGMVLIAIGFAVGLAAALELTRHLESLLFEVDALDPVAFVLAGLVLAAVGLIACYLPARRAASVDPVISLRAQ